MPLVGSIFSSSATDFSHTARTPILRANLSDGAETTFSIVLFIVIVVRSRRIIPVVTRTVVSVVTPLPVVAILTACGPIGLCKNCAALLAELRTILPQASYDPVHIGNLRAA